jgi:type IV pilus assembly protein PilM
MADKVIGLDVGTSAVRAVSLSRGTPTHLDLFGQVDLPPGVVAEGEVVDPGAVAHALRQLWKDTGLKGRSVRLAIASPRVIVRTVDMPVLSDADTRAALQLQLGDYIPMAPEATVFDFQPLDGPPRPDGDERQLLLAAAPRDAVRPLGEAVRQAGLRVEHVDVAANALARLVRPVHPDLPGGGGCEAIASIGAGAIVVTTVNGRGEPVFSRTITNVSGRHVTDRIATELSIPAYEAERLKRHVPDHESADVAARVLLAADPFVTEICEEIGDSLDYFTRLPDGMPVASVAITGGGSLLAGVRERLERRLRVPVRLLDPFEAAGIVTTTMPPEVMAQATPFLALATGTALGAERTRVRQINLLAEPTRGETSARTRLIVAGVAAFAVVVAGALYVHESNVLSDVKAERAAVETDLDAARAVAAERAAAGGGAGPAASPAAAVYKEARAGDVDWSGVNTRLVAAGEPLGVSLSAFDGVAEQAGTTPTTTAPATSTPSTTVVASATATAGPGIGSVSVTGTAADLDVIAAWLDAVVATEHFQNAWVSSITKTADDAGGGLAFTATAVVSGNNLVERTQLDQVTS